MSDTLSPCPFCACPNVMAFESDFPGQGAVWTVFCNDCEAEGPHRPHREQAIAGWNTRPSKTDDGGPKPLTDDAYLVTDALFHSTALTLRSWLPGDLLLGTVERALREALKAHCIPPTRSGQ